MKLGRSPAGTEAEGRTRQATAARKAYPSASEGQEEAPATFQPAWNLGAPLCVTRAALRSARLPGAIRKGLKPPWQPITTPGRLKTAGSGLNQLTCTSSRSRAHTYTRVMRILDRDAGRPRRTVPDNSCLFSALSLVAGELLKEPHRSQPPLRKRQEGSSDTDTMLLYCLSIWDLELKTNGYVPSAQSEGPLRVSEAC
ncbi:hypothetical protein TREES_T100019195 [Tupaia chinensis]|uniref:Uncharacterized protein n=1 Tax=Tupaia chinensis TaxID=246437 RepID=L9L8G0_TUPCH|nr:hypothetical protein TREES_T100019195 [Tupaia chinensis]